jgi:hypothetical protein
MRYCHVEIKGSDGQMHAVTLQAASLFDAARSGVESWAKLWWFDPAAVIVVKSGDEVWRVRQERLRQRG